MGASDRPKSRASITHTPLRSLKNVNSISPVFKLLQNVSCKYEYTLFQTIQNCLLESICKFKTLIKPPLKTVKMKRHSLLPCVSVKSKTEPQKTPEKYSVSQESTIDHLAKCGGYIPTAGRPSPPQQDCPLLPSVSLGTRSKTSKNLD